MVSGRDAIPWAKPEFWGNEKRYVLDALDSTWISGGKYVDRFESEFANYCGCPFGVSTSNGTTALHLTLVALGIGQGDEVIVPTFTFAASANVVIHAGARPVFADSDLGTWVVDPASIERAITPRTKAIIAVHIYGQPCDMTAICSIAEKHGLYVVEDAAEAHGTKSRGRHVGSFGTAGCFSFHAAKTLTMGEGGIVVTKDEALYGKMKILRDHGMRKGKSYWHDYVGYNYRLTNVQAAIGCAQLENMDKIVAQRRGIGAHYRRHLQNIPGLTCQGENPWADRVLWAQAVLIDRHAFGMDRDELMRRLTMRNIETRPAFYPLHTMPIYGSKEHFPNAEFLGANGVSLPTYHSLSEERIEYIAQAIREEQASAGIRSA